MSYTTQKKFDVVDELHKAVVTSLTTSFGLDFLLLDDKKGGNVDTIHNARNGIYATQREQQRYDERGEYNSTEYHSHPNYKARNKQGAEQKSQGTLIDSYTGKTFASNDKTNLDHVVSAKEVHDDPGRVLAGIKGSELANRDYNLTHTNENLNKAKQAKTMSNYIEQDKKIRSERQKKIKQLEEKPNLTDQERKQLKNLKNRDAADYEKMKEIDEKARKELNREVNKAYYMGSRFAKDVGYTSVKMGFQMGTRQALGLVLAEVWFELKDAIPNIFNQHSNNFNLKSFFDDIQRTLKNIWTRIRSRFKDLLQSFKDGFLGGILANISTVIMNIFVTSTKMIGKLIREVWGGLVKAIKLLFFNPDKLSTGSLWREVSKILSASVAVAIGVWINNALIPILGNIFMGGEIAIFISALVSSIITVGFHYFIEHSELMKKVWTWLDQFKDKFDHTLEEFQKINTELDIYLIELSKIEFNINTDDLSNFIQDLKDINSELETHILLKREITKRNIDLPFDSDNLSSVSDWLKEL